MVQSEIFNRVFRFIYGTNTGTTFTVECNDIQFLVTAKHIFKESDGFPNKGEIRLLKDGNFQKYQVTIKYPKDDRVDIAVMKPEPEQYVSQVFNNPNTSVGIVWGQDVYFLGFPYEYDRLLANLPGNKTPTPFVKKACFSGMLSSNPSLFLLDGHNNEGFSGGPVCFKEIGTTGKPMSIAGVISGYQYLKQKIYYKNDAETEFYAKENTGIIIAYDIAQAIEVAENWDA